MHDTKELLSLLWIFALLNYLYADWRAWTWSGVEAAVSSERIVHKPEVIA